MSRHGARDDGATFEIELSPCSDGSGGEARCACGNLLDSDVDLTENIVQ